MTDKRPVVQVRHIRLVLSLWQKIALGIFVASALITALRELLEFFGFLGVGEFMDWLNPPPPPPDVPAQ